MCITRLISLEQLIIASYKQLTYVPPHARGVVDYDARSFDGEVEYDHKLQKRGQMLIFIIFFKISKLHHTKIKFFLQEFNGEHNGVVFVDWLLQVESIFDYKNTRIQSVCSLIETKQRKGPCTS